MDSPASIRELRWTLYVKGGILIALGLWSLTYPLEALLSLAFALGLGFCLSGISHLVPCFTLRGSFLYPRWFLLLGILDLLIGFIMLTRLGITAFMIPVAAGGWLFFTGLVRVGTAVRLRSITIDGVRVFPRWWLLLLSGLALTVFACYLCASPLLGALSVVVVLGGGLVVSGVLHLIEGYAVFG
ncbi:MAG: DUF308 domain-containing protein [Synergistaceae bacterium]|nr:DUF308 domain-containing protein [Synergistaceae bacterium]